MTMDNPPLCEHCGEPMEKPDEHECRAKPPLLRPMQQPQSNVARQAQLSGVRVVKE